VEHEHSRSAITCVKCVSSTVCRANTTDYYVPYVRCVQRLHMSHISQRLHLSTREMNGVSARRRLLYISKPTRRVLFRGKLATSKLRCNLARPSHVADSASRRQTMRFRAQVISYVTSVLSHQQLSELWWWNCLFQRAMKNQNPSLVCRTKISACWQLHTCTFNNVGLRCPLVPCLKTIDRWAR